MSKKILTFNYLLLLVLTIMPINSQSEQATNALINFGREAELKNWFSINDTVMGGRSQNNLKLSDSKLIFNGLLSLANNGGFSSIRRELGDIQPLPFKHVRIRVLGDGRSYQLRFRTNAKADSYAYRASFQTSKNKWLEFEFNQADFAATFRGKSVVNAPDFTFSDAKQMGFLLGDKTEGEFELQITQVTFF